VSTNFSGNTRNRKEARSGRKEVDNLVKHLNMAGTMTRRSVAHYPNMSEAAVRHQAGACILHRRLLDV
jgi:hypothetical protein